MNPGAGLAAEILNFWLPFRKLCYVGLLLLFLETFVNFAPGRGAAQEYSGVHKSWFGAHPVGV